jgi:hypothetical protein
MGNAAFSLAAQTVDLSGQRSAVRYGDLVAHLEAQVRDWEDQDEVWLSLTALDAGGGMLSERLEGPFIESTWHLQRVHLHLPVETDSVVVRMGGARAAGTDNNAYVDALTLCIDRVEAPTLDTPLAGPYLMNVAPDGISVLWETTGSIQGALEVGPADGDWDWLIDEPSSTDHHEVRVGGLLPDTSYKYRIRFGNEVGEIYSFRTAPDLNVPFRFTVWGDNQNGPDTFAEVVDRMEGLDPDFALAVGDIVETGTENNYRTQLLDPILDLALDTPFVVAAGNHERLLDADASMFNLHMAQPEDEHCFGWTYAGAYFLIIDTDDPVDSGTQGQCITDALASPEFASSEVQFAAFHYPPRIEYWAFLTFDGIWLYDGDPEVRDVLEPQLAAAGVDLVLNGHNHLYNFTPPGTYSTVAWVTTGGGGGALDTDNWDVGSWAGIDLTLSEHHFLHVMVDGKNIDVDVLDVDGLLLDHWTVVAD